MSSISDQMVGDVQTDTKLNRFIDDALRSTLQFLYICISHTVYAFYQISCQYGADTAMVC